jgi:hypothetical protein
MLIAVAPQAFRTAAVAEEPCVLVAQWSDGGGVILKMTVAQA